MIVQIISALIISTVATLFSTNDPTDIATWSDWSQWSPANNTNSSVITIKQTRTRSCDITVNGNIDEPAVTCIGSDKETRTTDNPLAADTTIWSNWSRWSPANNPNTSVMTIEQSRTRSCIVVVNGNKDVPPPALTCIGSANETQIIDNPLAADTAIWSDWSQWSPPATSSADTSVINIKRTRVRNCDITVNGNKDKPAVTCSGSTRETQTVSNPLAADIATWSDWSQWTPVNNTDTSVISIEQTRARSCNITINGDIDDPAVTCSGSTSETQTASNPLAADTAIWSDWSQWSPSATSTDISIINIVQTRVRNCDITVNGNIDAPAVTCIGSTSETQTVSNPLAADTAIWSDWSQWSPVANADTSIMTVEQTRFRSCDTTINGDIDDPAVTCIGSTSETQIVGNPLAADIATWSDWSQWSPVNNTDTSILSIEQTRVRSCSVKVNGHADSPVPSCSGSISETRIITNPLAVGLLQLSNVKEDERVLVYKSTGEAILNIPGAVASSTFTLAVGYYTVDILKVDHRKVTIELVIKSLERASIDLADIAFIYDSCSVRVFNQKNFIESKVSVKGVTAAGIKFDNPEAGFVPKKLNLAIGKYKIKSKYKNKSGSKNFTCRADEARDITISIYDKTNKTGLKLYAEQFPREKNYTAQRFGLSFMYFYSQNVGFELRGFSETGNFSEIELREATISNTALGYGGGLVLFKYLIVGGNTVNFNEFKVGNTILDYSGYSEVYFGIRIPIKGLNIELKNYSLSSNDDNISKLFKKGLTSVGLGYKF